MSQPPVKMNAVFSGIATPPKHIISCNKEQVTSDTFDSDIDQILNGSDIMFGGAAMDGLFLSELSLEGGRSMGIGCVNNASPKFYQEVTSNDAPTPSFGIASIANLQLQIEQLQQLQRVRDLEQQQMQAFEQQRMMQQQQLMQMQEQEQQQQRHQAKDSSSNEYEEGEQIEKPKRSLSSYNLFFQRERNNLLKALPIPSGKKPRKSHGKIGFADMARTIAAKWKQITPENKKEFDELAKLDGLRYKKEMTVWKKIQEDSALKNMIKMSTNNTRAHNIVSNSGHMNSLGSSQENFPFMSNQHYTCWGQV